MEKGKAQWVLDQLVLRHGPVAVIALFPPDMVKSVVDFDVISCVPLDVWSLLLSFTALSDTFVVMQVCKAWHAASKRQQFWHQRILEKKEYLVFINCLNALEKKCVMAFNTFCHSFETLKDQVEWLFHTRWLVVVTFKGGFVDVRRKCESENFMTTNYFTSSGELSSYQFDQYKNGLLYRNQRWFKREHKHVTYLDARKNDERDKDFTRFFIHYVCENGHTYKGQGEAFEDFIAPHGDGEWTFSNGTTLKGEGVAWKGQPRFTCPEEACTTHTIKRALPPTECEPVSSKEQKI